MRYAGNRTYRYVGAPVASREIGYLLYESHFALLDADSSGAVDQTLPNGMHLLGRLCKQACPKTLIEVRGLPRNSFYEAAEYKTKPETHPYAREEVTTWEATNLTRGITFSFIKPSVIKPPYHVFRTMFEPFLLVASLPDLLVTLLEALMAAVTIGGILKAFKFLFGRKTQDEESP